MSGLYPSLKRVFEKVQAAVREECDSEDFDVEEFEEALAEAILNGMYEDSSSVGSFVVDRGQDEGISEGASVVVDIQLPEQAVICTEQEEVTCSQTEAMQPIS